MNYELRTTNYELSAITLFPCNVEDGYFQVTLPGPGDSTDRLRVSPTEEFGAVSPAIEEQLNERQKRMAALLVQGEALTSRRCEKDFRVTRDTTSRDFVKLIALGIAEPRGQGRSRHYVRKGPK
jgi:predicted HTH transcriptional regulator